MKRQYVRLLLLFFLSLGVYVLLCYHTERTNSLQLLLLYSASFLLYGTWYQSATQNGFINESLLAAIFLRAALLFCLPNLSDDFYRFIWDGRLSAQGISPFSQLPAELLALNTDIDFALFERLNSKEYYSIYPPVSQFVFFIAARLAQSDILVSVVVLKLSLLLFEVGTFHFAKKLLREFGLRENLVLLYALNPLVIVELSGNIHFEAAMIFFTTLAVYCMVRGKYGLSAMTLSFAVCTKFWPLLFVPFFYKRFFYDEKGIGRSILKYLLWVGVVLLFSLLWFFPFRTPDIFPHIGASMNLYVRYFEFNGSVFYFIRWLGFHLKGYDIIRTVGPLLTAGVTALVLFYFFSEKKPCKTSIFLPLLFALSMFLFLATTVHPWYVTPLTLFCIFTPYRFPLVWSALVPFTYVAYASFPVKENEWIILAEYAIVFACIVVELWLVRKGKAQLPALNRSGNSNNQKL